MSTEAKETTTAEESNEVRDLAIVKALIDRVATRKTNYDLSVLKYFNPLFIQYFIPEIPDKWLDHMDDSININPLYFADLNMQVYDMFDAMLYIEREVFPKFTLSNLNNIKAEDIVTWIMEIHKRCAQTINEAIGAEAGVFLEGQVTRCHQGIDALNGLCSLWCSTEQGKRLDCVELSELLKQSKLDEEEIKAFIELFERLENDESINLNDYYPFLRKQNATKDSMTAINRNFYKLGVVYNENKLTELEKRAVEKFSKICLLPRDMRPAVEKFSVELLDRMRRCKINDDSVCELLAWTFQRLTDIHCFSNGNGRNSILFSNAVLRCFNNKGQYPAILLRTSEQRQDKESSYSRAIDNIDRDISFLISHFKLMLSISRENRLKTTSFELKLIRARVVLAIEINFIRTNIAVNNVNSKAAIQYAFDYYSNKILEYLKWAQVQVQEENAKSEKVQFSLKVPQVGNFFKAAAPVPAVAQVKESEEPKEIKPQEYIDLLKSLTGLKEAKWKIYPKQGNTVTVVVDREQSFRLKKMLDEHSQAFSVRVCKNGTETKTTLLTFENLNYTALKTCVSTITNAPHQYPEGTK